MSSTASSDPRQPSAAKPFVAPMVAPQDLPVDYSGFIAVLCAVVGVMLRYKLGSWLALIFCAQSLANMKNMENDLKQISMAMIMFPQSRKKEQKVNVIVNLGTSKSTGKQYAKRCLRNRSNPCLFQ